MRKWTFEQGAINNIDVICDGDLIAEITAENDVLTDDHYNYARFMVEACNDRERFIETHRGDK